MVIEEAPGFHEDQQGSPFVGPSGKLLTEALEKVGIRDYYVTNVVKCFPDGTPSSTEISACKGYLDEEIRTVRPRYILALGNSAWHFFGRGPISEHAGRESRSPQYDCWVMPVLHPAAILRNPNQERAWRADLYRFARLVRGELIEKPPVTTNLVRTRSQLEHLLRILQDFPFTYDFETPVLSWADKTWKPLTIAFGFQLEDLEGWTVPLAYPDSGVDREALKWFLGEMIPVMSDPTKSKTAHNAIFDDLCWYRLTGQLPYVTCDTMVLAHLLDENRQKGLKYLGRSLLGWPQWDIDAKKEHPLEQLAEYNAYDAAATLLLREKLLAELKEQPRLWDYFTTLEMPKIRALERLIARGIYVDRERLEERCAQATSERAAILNVLPISNPASTPQLKTWLYTDLKLTPPHLTPKGTPSTDEEAIKRLCQRYPEHQGIRGLLDWRKWNKFLTTYYTPLIERLETSFDGRVHPEYRSTSVETGRLASSFHTTPRDVLVRSVYTAPEGMYLISVDYSQIEARLAAWAAAGKPQQVVTVSPTMLAAWFTGRDVYREQAAAILSKPVSEITSDERQMLGKVPVLSMLYAISPKGLQEYIWREYEIDWTRAQAQKCWDGFYALWPEFRRWHELMRIKIETDGFTVSECGRYRRLPAALYGDFRAKDEAVRSGINAPIQTLATEVLNAAMIILDQMEYRIVGSHHDALLFELQNDDRFHEHIGRIAGVMEAAHLALRPLGLRLPHGLIRVEIKAGGGWGEGKEIPVQVKGLDLVPAALVP